MEDDPMDMEEIGAGVVVAVAAATRKEMREIGGEGAHGAGAEVGMIENERGGIETEDKAAVGDAEDDHAIRLCKASMKRN